MLGGILIGAGVLTHPNETADPSSMGTSRWALAHALLLVATVPALLGLVGIYHRSPGVLGLIGFLLTFASLAMLIFVFALELFVVPVLSADSHAQAVMGPNGPLFGGPLGLFLQVISLIFTLGMILLGVAILRSGGLPKWSGVLLIIASPVSLVPPLPYMVLLISGVALGLAFVGAGFAIWSGRTTVGQPSV